MTRIIKTILTDPVGFGHWHMCTQQLLAVCAKLGIRPCKPQGCRDYIVSCEDARMIDEYYAARKEKQEVKA